ncbi:MAG: hypothetical protein JNL32_16010, partial [Candidatus Kapabacteria bacterium]|nr:hypothetical protein [Candidatus Kapabacteria bacterium]
MLLLTSILLLLHIRFTACIVVLCLVVSMIIGCSHAEKFDDTWRPPPVNHPVEYVTDSLYVVHTVNEFIRVEYNIFHYYHTFKIPEHEITIYIDSLVYSPDSLKMIAFVGIKSP